MLCPTFIVCHADKFDLYIGLDSKELSDCTPSSDRKSPKKERTYGVYQACVVHCMYYVKNFGSCLS